MTLVAIYDSDVDGLNDEVEGQPRYGVYNISLSDMKLIKTKVLEWFRYYRGMLESDEEVDPRHFDEWCRGKGIWCDSVRIYPVTV